MDIWFAGETALEVMRKVRLSDVLFLEPVSDVSALAGEASGQPHSALADEAPVRADPVVEDPTAWDFGLPRGTFGRINFVALGLSSPPTSARPVYIRVPKASDRRRADNVHCLVIPRKLSPGAVFQLKSRVTVSQGRGKGGQPGVIVNEVFDGCRVLVDSPALACTAIAASYQTLAKAGEETKSGTKAEGGNKRGGGCKPEGGNKCGGSHKPEDGNKAESARTGTGAKTRPKTTKVDSRVRKIGTFTWGDAMVRLVEVIMELTGHYGRDPADPSAGSVTENLSAFTSVEVMRAFLVEPHHWRGVTLFSQALDYARNGSRSPMETCL